MTSIKGLFYLFMYLFYVYECFTCVCVGGQHPCGWCTRRSGEAFGSPGNGITVGCQQPCGRWESHQCPLQEQKVLLMTEPSLQPRIYLFLRKESHLSQTGRTCYVAKTSLEFLRILLPQAPNPWVAGMPHHGPLILLSTFAIVTNHSRPFQRFKQQLFALLILPLRTVRSHQQSGNLRACCKTYNNTVLKTSLPLLRSEGPLHRGRAQDTCFFGPFAQGQGTPPFCTLSSKQSSSPIF